MEARVIPNDTARDRAPVGLSEGFCAVLAGRVAFRFLNSDSVTGAAGKGGSSNGAGGHARESSPGWEREKQNIEAQSTQYTAQLVNQSTGRRCVKEIKPSLARLKRVFLRGGCIAVWVHQDNLASCNSHWKEGLLV